MKPARLQILRGGLQTTVQATPRLEYRHLGVAPGGAADCVSFQQANLLAGNAEHLAVLEMTLLGDEIAWPDGAVIAVTGADMRPELLLPDASAFALPQGRPVVLPCGSVTRFGAAVSGCRSIVAVAGGIDVPVVLGSRSTLIRSCLGGYSGRALQAGDELQFRLPAAICGLSTYFAPDWYVRPETLPRTSPQPLRCLSGAAWSGLSQGDAGTFLSQPFRVRTESDRMGARLEGPRLQLHRAGEQTSEPTTPGTVQLLPDGSPLLLLADAAPTGGYPQIAHVITADLPVAAQLIPGDSIEFQMVQLHEAELEIRRQQQSQRRISSMIRLMHKACSAAAGQ